MGVDVLIETERLKFRQLTSLDALDLLVFFSDDESMRYMPSRKNIEEAHEWLTLVQESYQRQGYGPWALVQKSSKRFLGYCGLYLQKDVNDRNEVELLYGIIRHHWGNGYASEAATAVVNLARRQFRLERLISLIEPGNTASIHVAKKVGMTKEGKISRWGKTYHLFSM